MIIFTNIVSGFLAGILISIGGTVYLSCYSNNKIIGAILFSIALLCICFKDYSLFTGRVGYIIDNPKSKDFSKLFLGLLGNIIATFMCGGLIGIAVPNLVTVAQEMCSVKLEQNIMSTLIRGFMCGVLMFLAVDIYKRKKTIVGILFCIPVFILSGFEHSIADTFYFTVSKQILSLDGIIFLLQVLVWNAVGSGIFNCWDLVVRTGKENENG